MKKWEYKYIRFFPDIYVSGFSIRSGIRHMIVEDGKNTIILNGEFKRTQVREHGEAKDKEDFMELPEFIDYLNQLDREGREVIGDVGHQRGINYLLKRLVEE